MDEIRRIWTIQTAALIWRFRKIRKRRIIRNGALGVPFFSVTTS